MRLRSTIRGATVLCALLVASMAFGQWTLTWFIDPDNGSTGLANGQLGPGNPLPEGSPVYLIQQAGGAPAGLDPNGFLQGGDTVVALFGGGQANVDVGDVDQLPFNPQGPGEFYQVSTLDDSLLSQTFYVIAFDDAINYNSGTGQFLPGIVGTVYWGMTAPGDVFTAGVGPNQFADFTQILNTPNPLVPEPTTIALMVAGLGGVVAYRKRRSA